MAEKRKKILYVITKSNFGGAQKYVYDLAINLPKDQYEVVVALGGDGELSTRLKDAHVRVIHIESFQRNISLLKELKSFVELHRLYKIEKPDVVHLNSSKAGGSGSLMARIAGIPNIIFTAHAWAFNEDRSLITRMLIKCFVWWTLLLTHKTIAVSHKTARDVSDLPFVHKKIQVIHNAEQSFTLLHKDKARKALTHDHTDKIWIGTIAELHRNKGIDIALRAIQKLREIRKDFVYVVIGGGEKQDELLKYVETYKLHDIVIFAGQREEAKQYLHAFDVFLIPSRTEALSYVALEAGSAGLPIVASNVGGLPEIIEHEKYGLLIDPNDDSTIATALQQMLNDKDTRETYGRNLQKRIKNEFAFEDMIAKTSALY